MIFVILILIGVISFILGMQWGKATEFRALRPHFEALENSLNRSEKLRKAQAESSEGLYRKLTEG